MTGFGRGSAGRGLNKIDVEIRSVNSRFLEMKFRGFSLDPATEQKIRALLEKSIQRGNAQVRVELNVSQDNQKLSFNKDRFEMIQDVVKKIHVSYGQRMSLSDIISTHDLLKADEPDSINQSVIIKAVEHALNQLNEMREKEGKQIQDDILKRIKNLQNAIDSAEHISGNFKSEKQAQLQEKISELLNGESLDESRLIQEVAYLADRADVTEEIVRCRSHFDQLHTYLDREDPVGKRINFLIQEIGREINTIGSKSPQTDVTKHVVEMKGELEKIREQAQNIL
ncbi:MAG: YicC family protein [Candidatus Marinimicrobia bacterium]|nr:YicC family protein [Candidatus Neomarinimicrobiota bacterium]MEC7735927.1 YicC/YloC family endoribonuclease [Candidatus Neomarinimicrobiota bacterium]